MPFADANGQYQDRVITCRDCTKPFTFEVGEQAFYDSKQLEHAPTRCKPCRDINKARSPRQPPQAPEQPAQAEHARAKSFWQDDEDRGSRRGNRR